MKDSKSKKTTLIWCSVCGALLLFAVAATVFSVVATKKNTQNQDEIANLKSQIAEKDIKIAELNREANIRRKIEKQESGETDDTEDVEEIGEEEMAAWNDLYNSTIVSYATAVDYIYMPQIGKKLKVSDKFSNVKYSFDRYGITVWATAKGEKNEHDFSNPTKNFDGIGVFSIYNDDYRTKWTKITNQLFTVNYGHGEEFILESNHNHLTYTRATIQDGENDEEDVAKAAEKAVCESFYKYAIDPANYEDM